MRAKVGLKAHYAICCVGTPLTMAHCTRAAAVQRSTACCIAVGKHRVGLEGSQNSSGGSRLIRKQQLPLNPMCKAGLWCYEG